MGAWSSGMPGSPTRRDSARFALRVREVTGSIPVVPLFFLSLRTCPTPTDDARGFFLVFGGRRRREGRFGPVSIEMCVLQDLSHAVEPACAARAPRKAGRNTRMMSCDAQRQLTASSERFSRASPTIWSTGERGTYVWAARGARRAWTASRTRASWRGRRTRAPRASRARSRARSSRRRRWATSTRCDDARDGHLLRPVVHGRRRARGRPQWSTDGDAPEGVQGIVSGLHEKSDRDQRALLRK